MISVSPFTNIAPLPVIPSDENLDSADRPQRLSRSRRNVGEPGRYWPQHSTVKLHVFDHDLDSPQVQAITKAASEWLPHINLKFEFVASEYDADVLVDLSEADGHGASAVGTQAREIRRDYLYSPTMALPRDHTTASFAYVVLHEFGHMLGARHAHQHPDANIPWNRASLDQQFARSMLERNFLPLPRSDSYDFLPYDPDSIMHYSIAPSWTTDTTFHSRNSILSAGDIAWANKAYPKAPPQPEPA